MNYIANEIINAGGQLSRKADSRYAVNLWYIPGGYDYVNARAISGFWSEPQKAEAEAFQKKYEFPGEMAVFVDLQDPRLENSFRSVPCKHCKVEVNYNSAYQQWVSDKTGELEQYCWVDPIKGSQLHEV